MGVIVRCADAVLDERTNLDLTRPFTESVLVVTLVRSEGPQIARIPAGDLFVEVGVTPFERGRTVDLEDSL